MTWDSRDLRIPHQVATRRCVDYDPDTVNAAVSGTVDLLGGIDRYVRPGSTVLLKPNLLFGTAPERAVTTHPAVLTAVGTLLADEGCRVIIADSPGAGTPYTPRALRKAYQDAGYDRVAREIGAELATGTEYRMVSFPDGQVMKQFPVIAPALDADAVVNVCKLKTHVFTTLSAATKNLFGLVPGYEKPAFHTRFPDPDTFSEMLVDLAGLVQPALSLADGVIAMGGDGPMSGVPSPIGYIIASPSPYPLDVAAARLMGMDPGRIGVVTAARRRGLIDPETAALSIRGDPLPEPGSHPPYPTGYASGRPGSRSFLIRVARSLGWMYTLYPVIHEDPCIRCGRCVRSCPRQAIEMRYGVPHIAYRDCIRCYCCHEMCPAGAISLRRPLLGRAVSRFVG